MRFLVILCALLAASSSSGQIADSLDSGEPANHPAVECSDPLPMAVLSLGTNGEAEIYSKVRAAAGVSIAFENSNIAPHSRTLPGLSVVGLPACLHLRSEKLQV